MDVLRTPGDVASGKPLTGDPDRGEWREYEQLAGGQRGDQGTKGLEVVGGLARGEVHLQARTDQRTHGSAGRGHESTHDQGEGARAWIGYAPAPLAEAARAADRGDHRGRGFSPLAGGGRGGAEGHIESRPSNARPWQAIRCRDHGR